MGRENAMKDALQTGVKRDKLFFENNRRQTRKTGENPWEKTLLPPERAKSGRAGIDSKKQEMAGCRFG